MYLRLIARGHAVRVFMSDVASQGITDGMLPFTSDWREELDWIRAAGDAGLILFGNVSEGKAQDELRAAGYNVIGGSGLGDRLETHRAYRQERLRQGHIRTQPTPH